MSAQSAHAFRIGDRVRSISDGFTKGMTGTIESFGSGGEPVVRAAFVRFECGVFAVALHLLVKSTADT